MPVTNTLLVRAAYGWDEVTRPSSIATHGRREALYGLGANASPADVVRTANARLDIVATPRYQYDAEHQPLSLTELAYRGYGVGDTLPMTVDAGSVTERVISLAVSEDDNSGQATVTASLHDVVMYASPLENFVAMLSQAVKKMIPGTGRGDWKEAQPVTPPAIPAPITAWVPPAVPCLAESFDGMADPWLGPDLVWSEYHRGQTNVAAVVTTSGTAGALIDARRCVHVTANAAALRAPDDSQLPGGSSSWALVRGTGMTAAALSSQDQTVSAMVTAWPADALLSGGSNGDRWDLILGARVQGIDTVTTGGQLIGYAATLYKAREFPGVVVQRAYVLAVYDDGSIHSTDPLGQVDVAGDPTGKELVLAVTGTEGVDLAVVVKLDGSTIISLTDADFTGWTPLPTGLAGGFTLDATRAWDHGTMDDVLALDAFSACPT